MSLLEKVGVLGFFQFQFFQLVFKGVRFASLYI